MEKTKYYWLISEWRLVFSNTLIILFFVIHWHFTFVPVLLTLVKGNWAFGPNMPEACYTPALHVSGVLHICMVQQSILWLGRLAGSYTEPWTPFLLASRTFCGQKSIMVLFVVISSVPLHPLLTNWLRNSQPEVFRIDPKQALISATTPFENWM